MPLFDAHVHVGQFRELYTSPLEIVSFLDSMCVGGYSISSTTTCEENYSKVIDELSTLLNIDGNRVIPILWLLPQMFNDGGLEMLLGSDICWRCIKIHPQLHPQAWLESEIQGLLTDIANENNLPILIHSGESEGCYPFLYENLIASNPSILFILAHGRPIIQTIALMKKYKNVWTDTAFMPHNNVRLLCEEGLSDRVLFGTDYPITRLYINGSSAEEDYKRRINDLRRILLDNDFEKIMWKNFERLYNCF